MMPRPRIVDLFCGCGGFSLGAHRAGLSPSVAFDVDPILTSSFVGNFPNTKLRLADVALLDGRVIEAEAGGRVDGVFGGPPCQAFSDIGRRSTSDPRRELLSHFFRIVAEVRPKFFVMENVRGLNYAEARPILDSGLNRVSGRYRIVGPMMLDAADFGAATRRRRLFVVGYDPREVDPIFEEDFNGGRRSRVSVSAAINDLVDAEEVGTNGDFDLWRIARGVRSSVYASRLRSRDLLFTGHRTTKHTPDVVQRFSKTLPGEVEPIGRHPRLDWLGQCPTLRAGTGSDRGSYQSVRPIHPSLSRVITVREAARLQGFPDSFRFHPTVWHSFRMIGNSVSPPMSEAIFSRIRVSLGLPKVRVAAE